MLDKPTQQFFDLWHEHSMSDFRFLRSQSGKEWFMELRQLASNIPTENWRKYALWLVDESQKATQCQNANRITELAMNAFDNHMRLIWS